MTAESAAMPALSSKTSGVLTTEHISEDVPENIIHISVTAVKVIFPVGSAAVPAAETKASETVAETASRILSIALTGRSAFLKGCKTELVVKFLLLCITKHVIGFCNFLEFLFRLLIPGVHVRMIFLRKLSVCAFDLLRVGVSSDSKDFIIISFSHNATSAEYFCNLNSSAKRRCRLILPHPLSAFPVLFVI